MLQVRQKFALCAALTASDRRLMQTWLAGKKSELGTIEHTDTETP
jgi:hypothetical protein